MELRIILVLVGLSFIAVLATPVTGTWTRAQYFLNRYHEFNERHVAPEAEVRNWTILCWNMWLQIRLGENYGPGTPLNFVIADEEPVVLNSFPANRVTLRDGIRTYESSRFFDVYVFSYSPALNRYRGLRCSRRKVQVSLWPERALGNHKQFPVRFHGITGGVVNCDVL